MRINIQGIKGVFNEEAKNNYFRNYLSIILHFKVNQLTSEDSDIELVSTENSSNHPFRYQCNKEFIL